LERALKRFEGQVQQVLYHFVLNPTSEVATQAAMCAGEQGKFWDFHRMLYARQAQWHRLSNPLPRLVEFAGGMEVDTEALERCVKSGRMQPLIEADIAYGRSLQVRSTPTMFVNNKRIVGALEADLVRTIRQELARARRQAQ
jgi:protein-disulfide isomerase